jgi:hypothetical protein
MGHKNWGRVVNLASAKIEHNVINYLSEFFRHPAGGQPTTIIGSDSDFGRAKNGGGLLHVLAASYSRIEKSYQGENNGGNRPTLHRS